MAQMYDAASTILQQKLSQVRGVGQVIVGGGAPPAVRVDVNPTVLNHFGLGLEDVRTVLGTRQRQSAQGADRRRAIAPGRSAPPTSCSRPSEYRPLIVAYRNGAPVRLGDIATVTDSVEDISAKGIFNGKPPIADHHLPPAGRQHHRHGRSHPACCRNWRPQIPADIDLRSALDRTTTIRASVEDVQFTLMISIGLVILVVFLFLRNRAGHDHSQRRRAGLAGRHVRRDVPGRLQPRQSVADGADDRHGLRGRRCDRGDREHHPASGSGHVAAARPRCMGAQEIGFTVLSISVSLVAVFIPILLMGGIVGRLFREFAVTLSVAIGVSMLVSLTTTPMMCATLLKRRDDEQHGRLYRASEMGLRLDPRWLRRHAGLGACGISASRCWSRWRRSASLSTCT